MQIPIVCSIFLYRLEGTTHFDDNSDIVMNCRDGDSFQIIQRGQGELSSTAIINAAITLIRDIAEIHAEDL